MLRRGVEKTVRDTISAYIHPAVLTQGVVAKAIDESVAQVMAAVDEYVAETYNYDVTDVMNTMRNVNDNNR